MRSIVDTLFVPIEISKLEPRIECIANELIDNIIERDNGNNANTMDLITDFAYPLPATVIAELLEYYPKIRILFDNGQII